MEKRKNGLSAIFAALVEICRSKGIKDLAEEVEKMALKGRLIYNCYIHTSVQNA